MNQNIQELKELIEEYEELLKESEEMSISWEHGSPEDMAVNDPGLQFEKDCEVENKYEEIIDLCREISK